MNEQNDSFDLRADLREALEALSDFRQFWQHNVTQTREGAGHHNPMWGRIAELLSRHDMNDGFGYFQPDPAYRPEYRDWKKGK